MKSEYRFIGIRQGKVLLTLAGRLPSFSACSEWVKPGGEMFTFDGYKACEVDDKAETSAGYVWCDIRSSVLRVGEEEWSRVAKGAELLNWSVENHYCSRCGARMQRETEISLKCTGCKREIWPQLSPCIIVLVTRGKSALLVHSRNFRRPFYGLVAGFVETGETLEQCVHREVFEETGLRISNLQYRESQTWPFPSQLMIGFTAEYLSGEICFRDHELTDGRFFGIDELPALPPPPSIARRLIDNWLTKVRDKN